MSNHDPPFFKRTCSIGSSTIRSSDPSNSVSSTRPPRKGWEWFYQSFLSRSPPSRSNHQRQLDALQSSSSSGHNNDISNPNKSPPRKIKDRFKSLGNKLHRRSATSSGDLNTSLASNNTVDESRRISSSWTDTYTPPTTSQPPVSLPLSLPYDGPPLYASSPSSTLDPYPAKWDTASPPKQNSSLALPYHATFGRLQPMLLKGSYYGSGTSLSMIDETVNDTTTVTSNEFRPADFTTTSEEDVLFDKHHHQQQQQQQQQTQNHQERQVSNLSLQMKEYLTTKNTATTEQTSYLQGQGEINKDTEHQGCLPLRLSADTCKTEGGSQDMSSAASTAHDHHFNYAAKRTSKVLIATPQGDGMYTSTNTTDIHVSATVSSLKRNKKEMLDTSIRKGSVRRLGHMRASVSANSLSTMVFGAGQRLKLHDSKSRKLAFTKFHNSAQFGKDSASAFLGDDASVHAHCTTALSSDQPKLTTTTTIPITASMVSTEKKKKDGVIVRSPSPPPTSTGAVSLSTPCMKSIDPCPDNKNNNMSESNEKKSALVHSISWPVVHNMEALLRAPVLNALPYHNIDTPSNLLRRYTEDGTNCPSLIGPMVLTVCSSQELPPLLPCHSNKSFPVGMFPLGFAKVSRSSPSALSSFDKIGSTETLPSLFPGGGHVAYFVLYHNYLLEYQCTAAEENDFYTNLGHDIWTERPVGFAHLETACIRCVEARKQKYNNPLEEDSSALEVDVELDLMEIVFDGSTPNAVAQIKVLFLLDNCDELERWMRLLRRASKFTMDAVYTIGNIHSSNDSIGNGEIGRGRYSTIYSAIKKCPPPDNNAAVHNALTRSTQRALKVVSKDQFFYGVKKQRERADTLLREVAIQSILSRHIVAACLEPSNVPILQSLGMFETRTHLVLEMELLGGMDLFNYMSTASQRNACEGGGLEEYEARYIARNIFEALVVLKKMGIAHRDVKPANLLMCSTDRRMPPTGRTRVKLCDFGMATFIGPDGLVRGRCGTAGFVAPEILLSGLQSGYPNKVDTFSAGVTLYVMMCGYEPFYGESEEQLILANKEGKVEFPESDWDSVSSHAKDLISKLMEPNFANRIDVDDVLLHPWFQDLNATTDSEPPSLIPLPKLDSHCNDSFTGCIVS